MSTQFIDFLLEDLEALPNPTGAEIQWQGNAVQPVKPTPDINWKSQDSYYPQENQPTTHKSQTNGRKRALDTGPQFEDMASTTTPADETGATRMERKRRTEKMRRQEINDRLDELAQVLQQVEIPTQTDTSRTTAGSSTSRNSDKSKESHRVQLLNRAIACLKDLRYAYDCRTAELMKLALKMQQQGLQHEAYTHQHAPVNQPPSSSVGSDPASNQALNQSQPRNTDTSPPSTIVQSSGVEGEGKREDSTDYVPMVMMMPIWIPKGTKLPAPQLAPISGDLMGAFTDPNPPSAGAKKIPSIGIPTVHPNVSHLNSSMNVEMPVPPRVPHFNQSSLLQQAATQDPNQEPPNQGQMIASMAHCA